MSNLKPATLVDLLRWRAQERPETVLYTFLADGENEEGTLSYGELDRKARSIAARLRLSSVPGDRALLLYPPGLDFIAAFFGCMYAGVIAVPTYPPRLNRNVERLQAIINDSKARIALTTSSIQAAIGNFVSTAPELGLLNWITIDAIQGDGDCDGIPVTAEGIAFLQYTSGSTGLPKGVVLTHRNILRNTWLSSQGFGITSRDCLISWLPPYHDMGLIGGIFNPFVVDFPAILMPPTSFLQRPFVWLQAISRYKGTVSGGPNFAYDLCVQKITPEQRANLDLSSWALAFNGAEPVRAETIDRFAETFQSAGFQRDAFYPCYGLAESTLFVSGGNRTAPPVMKVIDREALGRSCVEAPSSTSSAQTLVGCGTAHADQQIVIVNPDTLQPCSSDQIGEVWVSDPSVAKGYWERREETEEIFGARMADGTGPFMRTGDLGFLSDQELFITGRLKDLIIIRGQNHYPQDIERTVERADSALQPGCGVAFSVDVNGQERLVIVQELVRNRSKDLGSVIDAIRQRVAEEHELAVSAIVLIQRGTLGKTTSGKVQRRATRAVYLAGKLSTIKEWHAPLLESVPLPEPDVTNQQAPPPGKGNVAEIEAWLRATIAQRLGLTAGELDIAQPLARYGVDSLIGLQIVSDVEKWLGKPVPATTPWDYPTIKNIAQFLVDITQDNKATPKPVVTASDPERMAAEPIAVIGCDCRFPGAKDVAAFWELLTNGMDAITDVPPDRWDSTALYDADPAAPGKLSTMWGGFLEELDKFDAQFFGISPREARHMDPQQRLVLEVTWKALEYAGLPPEGLAGTHTGVFVGIESGDYFLQVCSDRNQIDAYVGTGNAPCMAANRVSYLLDLHGPSLAVDTACSSSLVAVHLACQSLRNRESDLCIAGGVNVILGPEATINLSKARMLAADGRCKTFDERADGYVRSDGCGIVVLKRLSEAIRDSNNIVAIIRGSAVNQDGRSNGITAPNGLAQQAVFRRALQVAGVSPEQISYVEAHGTGTSLGDPIEIEALSKVLGSPKPGVQPCAVASVKTNIGHLETAAGVAGLIKVILALQHEEIPPHLHLHKINPKISFEGTRLIVPTERRPWARGHQPRIAAVTALSFGGTNAQLIIQEGLTRNQAEPEQQRPYPLCLSGKSERALRDLARHYATHIRKNPEHTLGEICRTADLGRSQFKHRLATIVDTRERLAEVLEAFVEGKKTALAREQVGSSTQRKLAFLFTGQGSQYPGMARQLYASEPVFSSAIDRCTELFRPHLAQPLTTVLYPPDGSPTALNETGYTQPALFAVEYALVELWNSWGVRPDALLGHSIGEYVAAVVAEVLSLEDAVGLVAERARLMQMLPKEGAMAVVFAPEALIADALAKVPGLVSISGVNGPENIVISGTYDAVQAVIDNLPHGVESRPLNVSHAFHSPMMESVLDAFERYASRIKFCPPSLPLVSNLFGRLMEPLEIQDANYWRRHLREPVRFAAGMRALAEAGCSCFLEIGPAPVLTGMGRRCVPSAGTGWVSSLEPGHSDVQRILTAATELWVRGISVSWADVIPIFKHFHPVPLPTYPFERMRYWVDRPRGLNRPATTSSRIRHPLLGERVLV